MSRKTQTGAGLQDFRKELVRQEKSSITVEKYLRDAGRFLEYLKGRKLCKESILGFKQNLIDAGYMVRSINSMLAAVNSYLSFLGKRSLRVKALRTQREVYRPEARELKKAEYMRLLEETILLLINQHLLMLLVFCLLKPLLVGIVNY